MYTFRVYTDYINSLGKSRGLGILVAVLLVILGFCLAMLTFPLWEVVFRFASITFGSRGLGR